jgi:transcriptional regulator with XRE-family HTH domain
LRKSLTQDQLAAAVGMMRSNISRIEAAKHRPTLETMEKIAKALKVRLPIQLRAWR